MRFKTKCIVGVVAFLGAVPVFGAPLPGDSFLEVNFGDWALGPFVSPDRGGFERSPFSFYGDPLIQKTVTDPVTGSRMGGTIQTDGNPISPSFQLGYGSVAIADTNPVIGYGVWGGMELFGRTQNISGGLPVLDTAAMVFGANLLVGLAPTGYFHASASLDGNAFAGSVPYIQMLDPSLDAIRLGYGSGPSNPVSSPVLLGDQDGMSWYRYAVFAYVLDPSPFVGPAPCDGVYPAGWCVKSGEIANASLRVTLGVDNGGVFDFSSTSLAALGLPEEWGYSNLAGAAVGLPQGAGPARFPRTAFFFGIDTHLMPEPGVIGMLALGLFVMGVSRSRGARRD